MLSTKELATKLKVGTTTIKRWVKSEKLKSVFKNKSHYFNEEDIELFLKENEEYFTNLQKKKDKIKVGDKFGRLSVVRLITPTLNVCVCDCGNKGKIVTTTRLRRGVIKKCGATCGLDVGVSIFNILYADLKRSNRRTKNIIFNLDKDSVTNLFKQNCYYCNSEPSRKRTIKRLNGGHFTYNGIDRIDSSGGYTQDNVVPCCFTCNRMKLQLSLLEFTEHIKLIYEHINTNAIEFLNISLPPDKNSIANILFRNYKRTAKRKGFPFELELEEFYKLIQGNCNYCMKPPCRTVTVDRLKGKTLTYNGVDRVDNSKGYTKDNTVSCCSNCNYMKHTLTIEEFKEHIEKVYNHFFKNERIRV